jgi:DNA primase
MNTFISSFSNPPAGKNIIEEIKNRLELVKVAQQLHPSLKRAGSKIYQGGHDGVHESQNGQCLTIWTETNSWKCFNCGHGGDVIDLIGVALVGTGYNRKGEDFKQALAEAADRAGIKLPAPPEAVTAQHPPEPKPPTAQHPPEPKPQAGAESTTMEMERQRLYSLLTEAARFYHQQLAHHPQILEYLQTNYGFTPRFIEHKLIGFAPVEDKGQLVAYLKARGYLLAEMQAASLINRGGYCRYQGRIMFGFWQNGQVIYFTARATSLTPPNPHEQLASGRVKKYRKLKVRDEQNPQISPYLDGETLLGIDNLKLARKKGYMLITEGVPDQLAAEQAGEPALSSATNQFSQSQLKKLLPYLKGLKVYLCNDNEQSGTGEKGALATARYLEEQGVKAYLISLPRPAEQDKLDLAEFLRDQGAEALDNLYKSALRLPDYRLIHQLLPREREDRAALVNELAYLSQQICHYDTLSLSNLQQQLSTALGESLPLIRSMFRQNAVTTTSTKREEAAKTSEEGEGGTNSGEAGVKKSQATMLVELMEGVELFHTGEQRAYASLQIEDHFETWSLRSKGFRLIMRERFYRLYNTVPRAQALEDAICVLEARGLYGPEIPVYGRLALHEGCIYVDLSNDKWEVVKISAQGWEILANSPVKFRRTNGMQPLARPVAGGRLDELLDYINVKPPEWKLLAAWLVCALNPDCQYPVLTINGEQGSAKSTACRFIRRLLDPSITLLKASPKDERDFWIAAQNSWVLAYDNLSEIPNWLSDTLCRVATGGGNATRLLYTDDEEVFFDARRPVLLNGISALGSRGDLLERSLIINLPAIAEEQRMSEKQLVREYEEALPRILGGLLNAASTALANVGQVKLDRLPRMADFTMWAVAAESAFGGSSPYSFLEVYAGQRANSHYVALEASPLGQAFVKWYSRYSRGRIGAASQWLGPAADLLEELEQSLSEKELRWTIRQSGWPKNARALSVQLHCLAPNLRALGIEISFDVYEKQLKRGIRIIRTSVASGTIDSDELGEEIGDGEDYPAEETIYGTQTGTQNYKAGTQTSQTGTQNKENELTERPSLLNFSQKSTQTTPNGTQTNSSVPVCVPATNGTVKPNLASFKGVGTQNPQIFENENSRHERDFEREKSVEGARGKSGEFCVFCVPAEGEPQEEGEEEEESEGEMETTGGLPVSASENSLVRVFGVQEESNVTQKTELRHHVATSEEGESNPVEDSSSSVYEHYARLIAESAQDFQQLTLLDHQLMNCKELDNLQNKKEGSPNKAFVEG